MESIHLCQRKYAFDNLFDSGLLAAKACNTPMIKNNKLLYDTNASSHDPASYRRLIARLLYLTPYSPYEAPTWVLKYVTSLLVRTRTCMCFKSPWIFPIMFSQSLKEKIMISRLLKWRLPLKALDLWEVVKEDYGPRSEITKKKKTRKAKAKTFLFVGVSQTVFTRIKTLKLAKTIWNYLREEYVGNERIHRIKEFETIKEYSDNLLGIANKMRLLGSNFAYSKIVEKILVTIPERYEASIALLENTKDLSKITLMEVIHALQAQEQRLLMRENHGVEGALPTKHHNVETNKKKYFKKNQLVKDENSANNQNKGKGQWKNYPPYQHGGKMGHPPFRCWKRPVAKC
ncbi:hypothetical protein CR513_61036, partial [Mucuna pruriens]